MKKISLFIILLVSLVIPQRAPIQTENWVALQSDTSSISAAGQLIMVSLNGSLNQPVTEAALTLRYDPACFQVTSHHPGSLMTGATSIVTAKPGQFDLTYHFQEKHQGNTGEGSLMAIQLEALKRCTSNLSVSSNSIMLKMLDSNGISVNVPSVEYRTLTLHLTEGPLPAATAIPLTPPVQTASQNPILDSTYLFLLMLILLPVAGAIAYTLLLRSRPKQMNKHTPTPGSVPGKIPALIHAGRAIPLLEPRTRLGHHIEIIQRGKGFYLTDTGSQHGTLLNGSHIGRGYYFLHDGDQVQLGSDIPYRFVKPQERVA